MFNKLKQYKDMKSQAKKMQSTLAGETVTVERGGLRVVMNGNFEIIDLAINGDLAKDSLEGMLMETMNEAIKKSQQLLARKVQEMGGWRSLT